MLKHYIIFFDSGDALCIASDMAITNDVAVKATKAFLESVKRTDPAEYEGVCDTMAPCRITDIQEEQEGTGYTFQNPPVLLEANTKIHFPDVDETVVL